MSDNWADEATKTYTPTERFYRARKEALEAEVQDLWAFVRKADAYMDAVNNMHDISMETRLEAAWELVEARSALRKYEP